MKHVFDDGGREAAGYKGNAGDCVCRAIAIASGLPYQQVYDDLSQGAFSERGKHAKKTRSARNGIHVSRKWFKEYMASIGFEWVPTMGIGTGCRVHLTDGELPSGRLVVAVSKHYTAVIDGVIHDTHDPQRATIFYENNQPARTAHRCVYGYYIFTA